MTAKTTRLGLSFGWDYLENGWNVGFNETIKILGASIQIHALSYEENTPPSTPNDGDIYIVAANATDDWTGHENDIAMWVDGESAWFFVTPSEGYTAWCHNCQQEYVFNGSAWVLKSSLWGTYTNDTAAAAGGVPVGGLYVVTSTGSVVVRLS